MSLRCWGTGDGGGVSSAGEGRGDCHPVIKKWVLRYGVSEWVRCVGTQATRNARYMIRLARQKMMAYLMVDTCLSPSPICEPSGWRDPELYPDLPEVGWDQTAAIFRPRVCAPKWLSQSQIGIPDGVKDQRILPGTEHGWLRAYVCFAASRRPNGKVGLDECFKKID